MTDVRRPDRDSSEAPAVSPSHSAWADHGDAALVAAIARGNRDAFAEVYERHAASAIALARNICGATLAAQVVHDAFLSLWQAPEAFDPDAGSLRTFVLLHVEARAFERIDAETVDGAGVLAGLRRPEQRALAIAMLGGDARSKVARVLGLSTGEASRLVRTALCNARAALDDRPPPVR